MFQGSRDCRAVADMALNQGGWLSLLCWRVTIFPMRRGYSSVRGTGLQSLFFPVPCAVQQHWSQISI